MLQMLNRLKSDESLMLAYQKGDVDAFEQLYRRHKDGLFAFLFCSCPRAAIVEELAQETWMAVIKAATRYKPTALFRTWLFQIAHNRLVDFWRRPDNQHRGLEGVAEAMTDPVAGFDPVLARNSLMVAIGQLPLEQRDVLLLQEQGFSLSDIAEITGAGEQTTKSRLRYARNALRVRLGDDS